MSSKQERRLLLLSLQQRNVWRKQTRANQAVSSNALCSAREKGIVALMCMRYRLCIRMKMQLNHSPNATV
jgi:hypothetical protein